MKKVSLTIGDFDGLHRGHKTLIKKLILVSKKTKTEPFAVTFKNDPNSSGRINSDLEKELLFASLGVRTLFFDYKKIRGLTGREFFERLRKKYDVKNIVVGLDFRFGKGRLETVADLRRYFPDSGIYPLPLQKSNGRKYSSSFARAAIKKGDFNSLGRILGRNYFIIGKRVKGSGLGTKLGFPTINLSCDKAKLLPEGIFLGRIAVLSGRSLKPAQGPLNCLVYIGKKSFGRDKNKAIEVYEPLKRLKINARALLFVELLKKTGRVKKFGKLSSLSNYVQYFIKTHSNYLYKS